MTVAKLTQGISGMEVAGNPGVEVSGIAYDSRKVSPGDLFAAVPGTAADGAAFVPAAIEAGASAIMMQTPRKLPVPVIVTGRVRIMMGVLAGRLLEHPDHSMNLIGITGTNGKTTTSYLVESIMAAAGKKTAVIGTVSYRFGDMVMPAPTTTPESVDTLGMLGRMREAGADHAVIEVSSHALDQGRMGGMNISTGVFTNLSRDHLDYHVDFEDYFQAKKKLFSKVITGEWDPDRPAGGEPLAVINMDDRYGQRLSQELEGTGIEVKSYAVKNERAWLMAKQISRSQAGIQAMLKAPGIEIPVSSSLVGMHNLENVLAAAAVCLALGADPAAVSRGVNSLPSVPGRLERVANDQDITVLVDYAHTPDALERAVKTCKEAAKGRLITVFGCGGDRDHGKRPPMGRVAIEGSDVAVVSSDNPRTEDPLAIIEMVLKGVAEVPAKKAGTTDEAVSLADKGKVYLVEPDRKKAIDAAIRIARPGDLVLIAGKGHEDYQILGTKKIHFDDREEAERALKERLG